MSLLPSPPEGFKMPFDEEAERRKTEVKELKTDTAYKAAKYIETYTGLPFYPLQPEADKVTVIDIAHALSNQCRFSGHVKFFYPTAQHSCLMASYVAERGGTALECLQILLHDAAECYLVDIPRPVKQFMPEYRKWDHAINEAIRERFHIDHIALPSYQDDLDSRIIVDERMQLMDHEQKNDWGHRMSPLGIKIEPWTPQQAEKQFLLQYAAYARDLYGTHVYINNAWGVPHRVHHQTASDMPTGIIDVLELDVIGGVARVKVQGEDGLTVRDRDAGLFPAPQWRWEHGKFHLETAK